VSVPYHKQILSDGKRKLFVGFNGVTPQNKLTDKTLSLAIYAIESQSSKHIFSVKLDCTQTRKLFNHLKTVSIIADEAKTETATFIEAGTESAALLNAIERVDPALIKAVLEKAPQPEKLKLILQALSETEIQDLEASIKQTNHKRALAHLTGLLELEATGDIVARIRQYPELSLYVARQPERIFQKWIERNTWSLGIDYFRKRSAKKIGIHSESDLMMETTDGFIDIIELKRPSAEILDFDKSHQSYSPSADLSKALGQCAHYLRTFDDYKLILEKEHKFKLLRPCAKLIIGRTNDFNEQQHEALRMLNSVLNHIEIISYDYLHRCGENVISYYTSNREFQC
jgi:hypothetical protein